MPSAPSSRPAGYFLLVFGLVAGIPATYAGIIDINSATDPTNQWNNIGPDVAIPVSPAWQPSGAGYEWISYASTGCNLFDPMTGICVAGPDNPLAAVGPIAGSSPADPTATFFYLFALTDDFNTGSITVWADDTARVSLDGNMLIEANPNLGGNCADAPIGCLPSMNATVDIGALNLTSGIHLLEIDAYQLVGASPFGVMYTGSIDSEPAPIPEPASYMLLGLGLAGIATLIPRARRS